MSNFKMMQLTQITEIRAISYFSFIRNLFFVFLSVCLIACFGKTAPPEREAVEKSVTTIAFGSCLYQWEQQAFWSIIAKQSPDLFIFTGDAIYADWDGKSKVPVTAESLTRSWQTLGRNSAFATFRAATPILATWDNHDYGTATKGVDFHLKEQSKNIFLDFFKEPQNSMRRERPGIYQSYYYGSKNQRVQILLLDTRSFRERPVFDERSKRFKEQQGIVGRYLPDGTGERTLLGAEQWKWLASEFKKPASIRFIVSGTQIIPTEKKMDEWGNYPHERSRLLRLIAGTEGGTTVLLTGNIHFGEISRIQLGDKFLYEITSSGLTHSVSPTRAANPHRIGAPVATKNFGVVRIDWMQPQSPVELDLFSTIGELEARVVVSRVE